MNTLSIKAPAGALVSLGRWLSYRDTVTELLSLTPSQLDALGVRGDVEAHAWRLTQR